MKEKELNEIQKFDIQRYVSKGMVDTFTLWALRIILNAGGIRDFIKRNIDYLDDTKVYYLLGLDRFLDDEESSRDKTMKYLREKLFRLESKKDLFYDKTLRVNIKKLSKIIYLNKYEEEILEFCILLKEYEVLQNVCNYLGDLNTQETKRAFSEILYIPLEEVEKCFSTHSKLVKSSLLSLDFGYGGSLDRNIDFITRSFSSKMMSEFDDIESMLADIICKCDDTDLSLDDFNHINKELSILFPYLKNTVKTKQKGVNILLYGVPGTGKTELAKVLAKKLKKSLYEISYNDEDGDAIEGKERLKAYKTAQTIFANKDVFLMFDEIEDVFHSDNSSSKRQKNKAWINRILENNAIPTVWITNDIYSIDDAIIRRFDMVMEVPIPKKSKRIEILRACTNNQLSEKMISKLAKNKTIAPALVSRAAKVVSSLDSRDKDKAFKMLINNTLRAQGYWRIKKEKKDTKNTLPKTYNTSFINCDRDLEKLTDGIKKSQNARICLYGVAGTGKSAYAKYIAKKLNKAIIIKKGSDLLSQYVGGTEQNIADAFREAKKKKAVLVFDEVDSFLADRTSANKNWEVTQVNEMLVQMEKFEGIFIATTNLMDNLDSASLRRFDLKLEFGFLKSSQAWNLFQDECKNLNIEIAKNIENQISHLRYLTPGDFAAVIRQNRFNPIENVDDFFQRLKDEVEIKKIDSGVKMGFI